MRKTPIAEGVMVTAIMATVLLMVSLVGLLLTHMGTMMYW